MPPKKGPLPPEDTITGKDIHTLKKELESILKEYNIYYFHFESDKTYMLELNDYRRYLDKNNVKAHDSIRLIVHSDGKWTLQHFCENNIPTINVSTITEIVEYIKKHY